MSETLILNKKINLYAQMCHASLFFEWSFGVNHMGLYFSCVIYIFEQCTTVTTVLFTPDLQRSEDFCPHCGNSLTALLFSSNLAPSLPVSRWFMMFLVLRLLLVRRPAAAISANTYCWFWFCKIQQAFVKLWAPLESIRGWNWGNLEPRS